jgi:predicted transcriptional regulator
MNTKLSAAENRVAEIIWDNEPLPSSRLVELCEAALSWKKSTTYTILKRLCEKGVFKNEEGVITSTIGRTAFSAARSREVVDKSFGGSLPKFIAAFTATEKLEREEIDEIQSLIDEYRRKNQ